MSKYYGLRGTGIALIFLVITLFLISTCFPAQGGEISSVCKPFSGLIRLLLLMPVQLVILLLGYVLGNIYARRKYNYPENLGSYWFVVGIFSAVIGVFILPHIYNTNYTSVWYQLTDFIKNIAEPLNIVSSGVNVGIKMLFEGPSPYSAYIVIQLINGILAFLYFFIIGALVSIILKKTVGKLFYIPIISRMPYWAKGSLVGIIFCVLVYVISMLESFDSLLGFFWGVGYRIVMPWIPCTDWGCVIYGAFLIPLFYIILFALGGLLYGFYKRPDTGNIA